MRLLEDHRPDAAAECAAAIFREDGFANVNRLNYLSKFAAGDRARLPVTGRSCISARHRI
jgi:hypothetical protein